MKRIPTLFLRIVILLIGIFVLAVCLFVLPPAISTEKTGAYRPILLGLYIPAVPFLVALYQALKLLNHIDKNKVFSTAAIRTLKYIKYCAFTISGLYVAGMPHIYIAAEKDDAPGVILIGLIIIGASFVIATATAVFQRLLQNAIDIKSENDLTV